MQIYDKDFHHKGLSKSHSSYFSENPDNRSKNEVSLSKRKIRERENEHLKEKGEKLESPNESVISFRLEGKKQCSCRGTNLNCYKCDGTGFIEENYDNPLLYEPILSQKTEINISNKQSVLIKLSSKESFQEVFKCPYCEMEYLKNSSLKIHIQNLHQQHFKNEKMKNSWKQRFSKNDRLFDNIHIDKSNKKEKTKNNSDDNVINFKHKIEKINTYKSKNKGLKVVNKINKKATISDLVNKGWTIK